MDELPIEYIEGRVTAGSINVDGASAVRRTCNLTLVTSNMDINAFYWGFKRKFILEVGIKNNINTVYPDIIWFNQGVFIITSFNTTQSTNNFTCTINGKDKMCLLNGDISGSLPHSVDFGVEEYVDKTSNKVTYISVPLKQIIYNIVTTFGNELPHNVIINDLDDMGLELLEYRGNTPLYMFKKENDGAFNQITFNSTQECYLNGQGDPIYISDNSIKYDNLIDVGVDTEEPSLVSFIPGGQLYHIVKFNYGDTAGYRLTDLTYAGDLVANLGEPLTSVLDKIKNMLGEFEYFYNINGQFVFQKKKNYMQTTWRLGENPESFIDNAINTSFPSFSLTDAALVTAFNNNPNLLNVRNDFSVWGSYPSMSGAEIPIHMRFALDVKPEQYLPVRSIWTRQKDTSVEPPKDFLFYNKMGVLEDRERLDDEGKMIVESFFVKPFVSQDNGDGIKVDWREIIYQMALDWRKHNYDDDFLLRLAELNPQWPTGKTGYEQYYIDLEGYWRQLYDLNPDMEIVDLAYEDITAALLRKDTILIKNAYRKYNFESDGNIFPEEIYVYSENDLSMCPLMNSNLLCIPVSPTGLIDTYYYANSDGTMNGGTSDKTILATLDLSLLYIKTDEDKFEKYLSETKINEIIRSNIDKLYVKRSDCITKDKLDPTIRGLYVQESSITGQEYYVRQNSYYHFDNFGNKLEQEYLDTNCYASGFYTYAESGWSMKIEEEPEKLLFWFDFLDVQSSDLEKFSVPMIGARTKTVNDSAVKSIYYRDIPTTIFTTLGDLDKYKDFPPGYTYINLPSEMEHLFSLSSRGKSAQEKIDELLNIHSYCIESATITTVPIYQLEPNSRIFVHDDLSQISGEYVVTKLTIPLQYSGTMSLTANKIVSNIM